MVVRAFVAVEVTSGTPTDRPARAPDHLTLQFLGEVPDTAHGRISALVGPAVRRTAPFDLVIEGVGAFPSPTRPRVVWVGVSVGQLEITSLAGAVRTALAPEFPVDREPFVPHLTLFRVRTPVDRQAAADLLEGRRPAPEPRRCRIEEVVLKQSVLGHGGAVHRVVAHYPLAGSGPASD